MEKEVIMRKVEGPGFAWDPLNGSQRLHRIEEKAPLKDQKIALLEKRIANLKLAEVGKPKSNWELRGLLGFVALALGFLAGE
jgi:hypothetical protein